MRSDPPHTPGLGRGGSGLYARVVDVLGQEIINGDIPVGTIMFADQICERLGVSRSVVRESMRTLGSMGLVEARPQVGTRVQPSSNWDMLNPYVVAWRGQGPGYLEQMKQLLELRLGVEFVAAGLAAQRMNDESGKLIVSRALQMREAFDRGDTRAFFEADMQFHSLMLEGSGNSVIAQLSDTIGATLHARMIDTRPGMHDLTSESVDRHLDLAHALADRDAASAQRLALLLVEQTLAEFEHVQGR